MLFTCKQLSQEAAGIFYGMNTFRFTTCSKSVKFCDTGTMADIMRHFFKKIGTVNRKTLKAIEVNTYFCHLDEPKYSTEHGHVFKALRSMKNATNGIELTSFRCSLAIRYEAVIGRTRYNGPRRKFFDGTKVDIDMLDLKHLLRDTAAMVKLGNPVKSKLRS